MRYKLLILEPRNGESLQDWTRTRREVWPRLDDALNDLAADGWQIRCPRLRSSTDDRDCEHIMILEHPACDRDEDYRQQVKRQEGRLDRAKRRLESAADATPMEAVALRQDFEEQGKKLKAIEADWDSGSPDSVHDRIIEGGHG